MSAGSLESAPRWKSLLVAWDAKGLADHALDMALECERAWNATLWVLHVVEKEGHLSLDAYLRAARERLRTVLRRRGEDGQRAERLLRLRSGVASACVLEEAQACEADVIFLGPHGDRQWLDFGSTARGVLAHARKAVWLQPGPVRPIRSILCPIDLSPDSLHALRAACSLAHAFGAQVSVLHMLPLARAMLSTWPEYPDLAAGLSLEDLRQAARADFERTLQRFEWNSTPHTECLDEGESVPGILRHAAEHDLIVMGSHGRTGLSAALLGNTTSAVMKRSEKPVLALRYPERGYWLA
jgi:nucleotide-binding universal stress UspA family protein